MDQPRHFDDLADELIQDILSFLLGFEYSSLEASPTTSHGSSTPLNAQSPHVYGEKSELDRFRLVCRRFMRIGTPQKFPRFVLRFSSDGFRRLEELLSMQLACHVRNFTYMRRLILTIFLSRRPTDVAFTSRNVSSRRVTICYICAARSEHSHPCSRSSCCDCRMRRMSKFWIGFTNTHWEEQRD
ncbi:F-box domain protein [Aspergillus brunneoviolaceus CBS 621.78]|uniref:Uncharacterized protein n=1 Tax=Aspergillus brunneoviolaceus CBS 621.78 TaxID=1450534 RepID=A0ACD1GQM5_9EURO|nr:hypothetical protein BO95DRAFT_2107 [Aspergillus brunneoviolaceus CBS 621.78]RAH51409.1 hypothetical protein BO95DRAFT_2107 [Aspergillus brunneoviolaceus CBS 621.78]